MSEENRITDLLELKDVEVTHFETHSQENLIFISVPRKEHRCPVCGSLSDTIHDYRSQRILDVPLYEKKTYLIYRKRRYRCASCGKRFFERNTFVLRYAHTTNRLFHKLYQDLHSVVSQTSIAQRYQTSPMRIRRLLDEMSPALPELPEVQSPSGRWYR